MTEVIRIHEKDNVAVAIHELLEGTEITVGEDVIRVKEQIPAGHKVAVDKIRVNEPIIKYGSEIGHATTEIVKGQWVHTHNMKTNLKEKMQYSYHPIRDDHTELPTDGIACEDHFLGYRRYDGAVGVRNELWILPTVGCVNNVVTALAKKTEYLKNDHIEEVIAFNHPYGCSQMGEDQENTRKILANLAKHANAAGVLLVGLGCENSGIEVMKQYMGKFDTNRVRFLVCQEQDDEMKEGERLLNELAAYASNDKREPCPVSKLMVGLKCGGSDGFSGITANPVVGVFSDQLVRNGGTTILTEVPEMFGAEILLMDRCVNEEVYQQMVNMIQQFKEYYIKNGQTIYENPSPGNKKGGISSLEDKSLGCTQKSGSSYVNGVYAYGDQVLTTGLNLLSAPGNDLVASTALAASGAQIILFTTGRGTPFASPVPTIKISSNSNIAKKKANWIDFDAGTILSKEQDRKEVSEKLYQQVLQVASGKQTKSELAGYHDMAIFKGGVTL